MKYLLAPIGAALICSTAAGQGADDCANAQVISGLGPHAFDNTSATTDGPSDCKGKTAHDDVWFEWTPAQTGGYVIDTCGSTSVVPRIMVYDDQPCPVTQAPIACRTGGCPTSFETRFSFPTTAGQAVLIRIGSRDLGASGTGTFELTFDNCWNIPEDGFEENDVCSEAAPVGDGTYTGLKSQRGDLDWYEIDVADGSTLTIDVLFTHSSGDLDILLFDGCGGATLDSGGSGDDDEHVTWTNSTGSCARVYLSVAFFPPFTATECNTYDLVVSGSSPPGTCSGNIGTNYCSPSNQNSSGQSAEISATGSVVVADNDVTLHAVKMAVNQFGMFVNSMNQGSFTPPGSQGVLCLSGSIGRHKNDIMNTGSGEFDLQLDLDNVPTPSGPVAVQPGETWYWQAWFRDSNPSATSNFTDGICITFQ